MIASFGNSTLVAKVKFPKLAIMTCGGPTCWAGGHGLAKWRRHPLAQPHQTETTRLTTFTSQQNAITPTPHTANILCDLGEALVQREAGISANPRHNGVAGV